jgi:histidine ammonia-lyase
VVENVQKILAIELLTVVHALHHRKKENPSFKIPEKLQVLYDDCAKITPPMVNDRYLQTDFQGLLTYLREELPLKTELINPQSPTK